MTHVSGIIGGRRTKIKEARGSSRPSIDCPRYALLAVGGPGRRPPTGSGSGQVRPWSGSWTTDRQDQAITPPGRTAAPAGPDHPTGQVSGTQQRPVRTSAVATGT